jgi:hypothetical protein
MQGGPAGGTVAEKRPALRARSSVQTSEQPGSGYSMPKRDFSVGSTGNQVTQERPDPPIGTVRVFRIHRRGHRTDPRAVSGA